MRTPCGVIGSVLVLALMVVATASGGQPVTQPSADAALGPQFKITSTLDGRGVLPHRIHWLATPSLAAKDIAGVDFLIDGKVTWIEHQAPYVYGNNDGPHLGYLVTSFLSPGQHRFTVRATSIGGRTATDTVTARVVAPPQVPAALAGTWERTVTNTSAAPKGGSAGNPTDTGTPPGRYTISFDRRWIHDVFPCDTSPCRFNPNTGGGGEVLSDWTPQARTFAVRGPVTTRVFHDSDRLGGPWCYYDGPAAIYTWTVTGTQLTLAPVGGHDACGIRGFIWSGVWKRLR